jgi:hypothetical protein
MKKIMIAMTALCFSCVGSFAQNTGPAAQSDKMQKPGVNSNEKGSMKKGTTGMSSGQSGSSGMVKPDASGQGGSGPGSDQGGTKSNNRQ